MKTYTLIIAFLFSLAATAQGVDSTRISQNIAMSKVHHIYALGFNQGSWGNVDYINYLNQVRAQMDSTTADTATITVTVPSSLVRDLFYSMSRQAEGEATQYNEDIQAVLTPQITNPWLGAAIQAIILQNWAARDTKIEATEQRILTINKLQ